MVSLISVFFVYIPDRCLIKFITVALCYDALGQLFVFHFMQGQVILIDCLLEEMTSSRPQINEPMKLHKEEDHFGLYDMKIAEVLIGRPVELQSRFCTSYVQPIQKKRGNPFQDISIDSVLFNLHSTVQLIMTICLFLRHAFCCVGSGSIYICDRHVLFCICMPTWYVSGRNVLKPMRTTESC